LLTFTEITCFTSACQISSNMAAMASLIYFRRRV